MWLKANSEQQFLYGHNVLKGGLGRITENTPMYQGVLVYSMNDTPLVSVSGLLLCIMNIVNYGQNNNCI